MRLQQKMAPQLIQSLRLLQMPTLELELTIKQELEINPMLEQVLEQEPFQSDDGELWERNPDRELDRDFDRVDWNHYLQESYDLRGYNYPAFDNREEGREEPRENRLTGRISIWDALLEQLGMSSSDEEEWRIGEYIIGEINEDGFLETSVEEISAALDVPPSSVERTLKLIRSFDPPGIGARDLQQCLMIQLEDQDLEDSLAMRIVQDHLDDLRAWRYERIAKALKVDIEEIQAALKVIGSLNPRPAANLSESDSNMSEIEDALRRVVPDVIIEKIGDDYEIQLNDRSVPSLRINRVYQNMLKGSSGADEKAKEYIEERLNRARWMINAIDQRRSTMLRVTRYIVDAQREFFDKGPGHLKPMILKDAADAIDMHASTVSRVTRGKYAQPPHGIFELKYFFDVRIGSSNGEDVAAQNVKDRIRQLVDEEDAKDPLSDQKIADLLEEEGIRIARRTVAKYRDQLNIPAVKYRKQL